ncbi:malonyl-CoA synthase [Sedimentitalea sp. CY04]|uniref:Malonyl-CoA synthase n=1 Tax=Parasedimentitalea denitrificans TaxID=2211118 RepID=A0ABX0WCY7_9RHOB|nr:malonyl-CoA synthase [Sedimentitalea sp. CY04]NIZ63152.1 malonyl-CoA synthase [Sedimentitalea sp. CY04]
MTNPLYDTLFGRYAGKATPFLRLPDGSTLTHDAFLIIAARYAHVFRDAGVAPGDRLAVQVEKSPQALAIYAACVQAGIVFLPLNTAYTASEVSYFVENSGAKLLVCDGGNMAALSPVAQSANAQLETLDANGSGSLATKAAAKPDSFPTVARSLDDLAAFLYTSGTTGRSKGAMLSQQNLLSNAETLVDYWKFTDSDVLLHALPIFHTHGLFVASNVTLLAGGSMIFMPKFDLDQVIGHLPQATTMMGVPTFYTRLLSDARFTKGLAQHMRLFISGSAPLLADTHIQFEDRTGHRILERYGMTETNMNTSNPYDGDRRAGTVGKALPGVELKITDAATGNTLPDGEIGQIEVRGANVFQGYWQMPEKTAEELREDGFFITGDLGLIDENGYVQIVGRNKDLIISGGYNIYPKEIELVLDDQPGVLESAVVGIPHPDFGETVVGFLVANGPTEPDLDMISSTVGDSLARFKHPKKLIILPELPRNTMGKVQKNLLRNEYSLLFTPQ